MAGARWVQREILEPNPEADLVVFAVSFDMLMTDSRAGWSAETLHDPRVVHLWDGERALGRWFAEQPRLRERGLVGDGVMWDTWLLFGPDARWSADGPGPLSGAGHTIVRTRRQLREEVAALVGSAVAASR